MEIWKDIEGYNGDYAISNYGRVRMVDGRLSNGWKQNKYGYRKVRLYKGKNPKDFYIHQLVALYFIPNPNRYIDVNHIDHDPSNNHFSNLEWTTQKLNMEHAAKHGRMNNGNLVLDTETNIVYKSVKEAATSIGMNPSTLVCKLLGKNKNDTKFITIKSKRTTTITI